MQTKRKNVTYILGAGFSHAITNKKALLTKELGEQLGKLFNQPIKEKYNFSPEDIELFLTKIDLDLLKAGNDNKELKLSRHKVTEEIYQIFKTSNFCKDSKNGIDVTIVAEKVVNLLFRKNDSILTLNYDCYLENLLTLRKKWDPYSGYGEFLSKSNKEKENKNILNINIYKLHGSVNFHTVVKSINKMTNIAKVDIDYEINSGDDNFPNLDVSRIIGGTIKEYFIAPSYFKQFNYKGILQIWREAAYKTQQADVLVIIGCSLRNEDYPLLFLVSQFNEKAKIFIIDPKANIIKQKLLDLLLIDPDNIKPLEQKLKNLTDEQANQIYL